MEHRVKLTKPIVGVLLVLVMIAVFSQSTRHGFINYDDPAYVAENHHVKVGLTLDGMRWAFTTFHAANWHPVTWLSHMLDCTLYGLKPAGHHLTNILFHIANTLLLLYLLYHATGKYWQSLFVAALFALHPLHIESVAWIAERKDLISTFFMLVTLIFYGRFVRRSGPLLYVLSIIAYALGLMSKPMLVTLPFVMLLWDFWPLGRLPFKKQRTENGPHVLHTNYPLATPLRLVLEKIPFFILTLASCIVTYAAQNKSGAVAEARFSPLLFRIINALLSYVRYIANMFYPHNLAVIYPLPTTLTIAEGLMAGFALLGMSYLVYRLTKSHEYLLTGWLWYLGTLVPVIGLVQVGKQAMADRYTYIPLIGLFIMVAWGVPALLQKWRYRCIVLPTAAILFLAILTIGTWIQLSYWRNGVRLFSHATEAVPGNYIAYRILGDALSERGAFAEAERSFKESLRICPDDDRTHTEWGAALAKQKRIDEAIDHFTAALLINPDSADAHYNLGIMLAEKGRITESISHYLEAIRISPDRGDAHMNLGSVYLKEGKLMEALYQYQQASRIDPGNVEINYSLGLTYGMQGNLNESVRYFRAALRNQPDFLEARYNLGIALVRTGALDEGILHFKEVLRINPNFEEARKTLEAAVKLKSRQSSSK